MTQSVLGSITLGYRPLWNRSRELAGVQLYVDREEGAAVDAPHLLRTLEELWSDNAPPLLLSVQSAPLLADLLEHGGEDTPRLEIRGDWLAVDPALAGRVRDAHARGRKLVWRGDAAALPSAELARCFERSLLTLAPEEAMAALHAAQLRRADPSAARPARSPVAAGQIYENVASRALMEHCLDQQQAWGLAGWPAEDVLHGYRNQPLQPLHRTITRLLKAVDADQSMEAIEHILKEEPVLVVRFLTYVNSPALGLREGVESLRHGLMMLGYAQLAKWLAQQLPHASTDANLQPIYSAMVLRAQLTEHLLDAGIEDDLRREVYLCGLFSQLDQLLGEPLGMVLRRLRLSERIYAATVLHSGPYAPSLQIAVALENPDGAATRALCARHETGIEEVNRALLRTLAAVQMPHA